MSCASNRRRLPKWTLKTASWIARIALIAGCLAYALSGVDIGQVADTLASYSLPHLAAGFGILVAIFTFMGLRLWALARGEMTPLKGITASTLSFGLNNILPARLGELIKGLYLFRKGNITLGQTASVIFVERLLDLFAMVVLIVVSVAVGTDIPGAQFLVLAATTLLVTLAFLVWKPGVFERLITFMPTERLRGFLRQVTAALLEFANARRLSAPVAFSALQWCSSLVQAYIIMNLLAGLDLTPLQILTTFCLITLGAAIPAAPAGLGMFEGAMVATLGWYGVDKSTALAVAITYRGFMFVPPTLCALAILAVTGLRVDFTAKCNAEMTGSEATHLAEDQENQA